MYGAPQSIELMKEFHNFISKAYNLSQKASLFGFSRGGLYAFNYTTKYPETVAVLYLDAPVLDICSWPAGYAKGIGASKEWEECKAIYGLTDESAKEYNNNPLNKIEEVAKEKIPIIVVAGDNDKVVPLAENAGILIEEYEELGGEIMSIIKKGVAHHPHSLKEPKEIVDFIIKKKKENNSNSLLTINTPKECSVFQRNKDNQGIIPLICSVNKNVDTLEYRVTDSLSKEQIKGWTTNKEAEDKGLYKDKIKLKSACYRIEVRALHDGKIVDKAIIKQTGIGEVFITSGQSNSANHGGPRQSQETGLVFAADFSTGTWSQAKDPMPGATGEQGSPWTILGDLIVKEYNIPVGFICTGVGGTKVEQWLPSAQYYPRLKAALTIAKLSGVRAILWHQGESDAIASTSSDDYGKMLSTIIKQSRKELNFSIPWGIALVSYHPESSEDMEEQIIQGQKNVINSLENVFEGPCTDSYHKKGYLIDGVHFNAQGLSAHANGWYKSLLNLLNR